MTPTLVPGDRLVVRRPWRAASYRVGDIVALPDPRVPARVIVKRIAALHHDEMTAEVVGDNPAASTDSRHFGPVPMDRIWGRVAYRYAPPNRAGRVPRK